MHHDLCLKVRMTDKNRSFSYHLHEAINVIFMKSSHLHNLKNEYTLIRHLHNHLVITHLTIQRKYYHLAMQLMHQWSTQDVDFYELLEFWFKKYHWYGKWILWNHILFCSTHQFKINNVNISKFIFLIWFYFAVILIISMNRW